MLALTKKSVANLEVYLERSVPQGLAYKWQELKGSQAFAGDVSLGLERTGSGFPTLPTLDLLPQFWQV